MIKVGLTGNIGSGKSLVCELFSALGIPVYNADLEARKILNSKETILELQKRYGKDIALLNGEIDRKKLAGIVFTNPNELQKLNKLIHPKLRQDFANWAKKHNDEKYIIQEAAILLENNFHQQMDKIITISAPLEIRLERVIRRDGTNKEDVLARMNNQWKDGEKEKLSDFVILNDGNRMLLPQILKIHQELNS
jgi:dephospho-CoA kinase